MPRTAVIAVGGNSLVRAVEPDRGVHDDPRALHFPPAANGLYVSMALLTLLPDGERT